MSRKKPSRFKLFAAGVILSCAVLCAPAFAVFYFLFSVLVFAQLLMRRKGKTLFKDHFSLLNGKAWTYLTVGVVLSATVFLLYLLAFSDVKSILFDVGFLRGSSSHSMTIFGNSLNYNKFKNYIVENSFILLICALIMISAVVYCCLRKHFRSSRVRRGVRAFLLIAVFAVFSVFLFVNLNRMFDTEGFGNNTIISVLSFVVFLLCDRKDRRMLAFFCLSLACSFSMDFLSNVTILFGSRLAYIPAFCCIGTVLRELRQIPDDQKDDLSSADNGLNRFFVRLGYVFSAAFIAALSLWIILWSNYLLFDAGNSPTSMTMIERGPYAGLIRKQNYCDDYFSSLDELDCIAQTGDGPVYISAMLPFGYLYMDRPIGICTTYYESEDELLRAMEYWEMYPEKRPSVIYIPKYSFDKDGFIARNDQAKNDLEKLNDLCVSSYEETDTGIVLSAVQWLPSFNAEKSG
ncbi:MAG: hypothetical protein IJK23_07810 [Clostridia bacterium]|nr:hypothetical protein [Clostridia bacterium]